MIGSDVVPTDTHACLFLSKSCFNSYQMVCVPARSFSFSLLTTTSPTLTFLRVHKAPRTARQMPSPDLLVQTFGAHYQEYYQRAHSCFYHSRRAAGSQVSKPNSTRAAGAGGSSGTMLKLYTDDSPGLRVYVLFIDAGDAILNVCNQ